MWIPALMCSQSYAEFRDGPQDEGAARDRAPNDRASALDRCGERGLRTLQRLNRRLLVDAEHDRVLRRLEIEAHDVLHLRRKGRIATHLVGAHAMRLEPLLAQHVRDAAAREPDRFAEEPRRPPTPAGRRRRECQRDNPFDRLGGHRVIRPARLRARRQPGDALPDKPSANPGHLLRREREPRRNRAASLAGRTQQNDPRTTYQSRRIGRPRDQRFQFRR